MTNALEVRNLAKEFKTFSLKDVMFDVPTGYITGFIGPNGAGKSTTIKSILNILRYDSGEITILGRNAKEKAGGINERIGVVLDKTLYSDDWNTRDVCSALSLFYSNWDSAKFYRLLDEYGIEQKKKVKELSRGMTVKLSLAAAFSHNANMLILDEPTSGLDPVARDELCDMLAEFVTDSERSVLFSTHITSDLEKIADYIVFILEGRIVFSGPKEELLEKYVMVKGGPSDLTREQKGLIIGLREHYTGFEGIIEADNLKKMSGRIMAEPVSLDEIIVYLNKGVKLHE